MSSGSLARRYAKALMEIGQEDGSYHRVGQDISSIHRAIQKSAELRDLLSNPLFPLLQRKQAVVALLMRIGVSATVTNFAKLLLEKDRMAILPDISRALSAMIDEFSGRVTAQVTSATPLTTMQQDTLRVTLEKMSGKKIQIELEEDRTLLGGVIAKVGDRVYDGSLRTQLREIRRSMLAN